MTKRDQILDAGVKNLREFGYPHVDRQNILTDQVYSAFFRKMLEESRGLGFDGDLNNMLDEIDKPLKGGEGDA